MRLWKETKFHSQIVANNEIKNYRKQHKISEKEALLKNPPKFHKKSDQNYSSDFSFLEFKI
ncbi:hypothetical protein GGR06_000533 [Bacteroides reticulotermitis]|uniref:Uncharacterized protein n=1 Tax=Bacteroides reticulotermitis TaxID=1133319 RepID=A0A840CXD5_9BACE|nr:hypothetical protein [Bacteroides reticulotermitis]